MIDALAAFLIALVDLISDDTDDELPFLELKISEHWRRTWNEPHHDWDEPMVDCRIWVDDMWINDGHEIRAVVSVPLDEKRSTRRDYVLGIPLAITPACAASSAQDALF